MTARIGKILMSLSSTFSLAKLVSAWKPRKEPCANPECRMSSVMHSLSPWKSGRKPGIRAENKWFCCPQCFEIGAGMRMAELINSAAPEEPPRRSRMPLGLLLLSRGCVNNDQLQNALVEQRVHGGKIGDIICAKGYASEQQVTAAAAAQWGYPVFAFDERKLHLDVHVPLAILDLYLIVPVLYFRPDRKLLVAFVNGVDHRILSVIEQMTGCVVAPCFVTPTEYRRKRDETKSAARGRELVYRKVAELGQMAGIVAEHAAELEAVEARFAYCRDYLWVRLMGARELDLLFKIRKR